MVDRSRCSRAVSGTEPDGKYRQIIKEAFAGYETWWQSTPRKPDGIQPGMLPGDFSCTFSKDGSPGDRRLELRLPAADREETACYQGKLVVDPRQFQAACGGDGVQWAESHHACFLMTHHPPDWLNNESREHLNAEILESFCLHLCGHNHETHVLQELAGGADGSPVRWLGRSLFGLEKARNGKLDRSHGYVAGELRVTDDGRGQLQFMPRRREKEGDNRDLVPDQSVKLPEEGPHPRLSDPSSARDSPHRRHRHAPPGDAKALFRRVVETITASAGRQSRAA